MERNKKSKNKQRIIPPTLVMETGLKTATLRRLLRGMLKIFLNKRKKSKLQKDTRNSRKINTNHTAEVIQRGIET